MSIKNVRLNLKKKKTVIMEGCSYLQLVDQTFLDRILGGGISGHAETFRSLPQLLLLLLAVWIGRCTL